MPSSASPSPSATNSRPSASGSRSSRPDRWRPISGRSLTLTFDGDGGPYADAIRKVTGAFAANRASGGSTPEHLADALYGAATDGSAQVRYVIGDDALALMQARKEIGEEALMVGLRQRFGLGS